MADSLSGGGGPQSPYPAGGAGMQRYSPVYDRAESPTVAEEYLPTDTQTQNKIFRKLVMFDSIAGPTTELWCDLAFSDRIFLQGLADEKVRQFYEDAVEASGIASVMPELLSDFLSMGRFVFHQLMGKQGYWTETIVHDLDHVRIEVSPFPHQPPLVDIEPDQDMVRWATSSDPRILEQRRQYDPVLVKLMATGKPIPLAPENTMFLPRKAYATDRYGSSYLTRILPFWIYEKALVDASITAARRRAGPLRQITVPNDYSGWEMETILDQVFAAEEDQLGGYIMLKEGAGIQEVTSTGRDTTWKLSDEWDFLSAAKMRALGISEALLSGEANWNSLEMIVSVFLEKLRAVRRHFTRKIIIEKMLINLAIKHGFVKTTEAHLSHHIRVAKKTYSESDLILPTVDWDRPIEPIGDASYMDLLDRLTEKELPIPIRMWAQASGYDLDKTLDSFESDLDTRTKIYKYRLARIQQAKRYGFSETGEYVGGEEEAVGAEASELFGGGERSREKEHGFGGPEELGELGGGGAGEEIAPEAPVASETPGAPENAPTAPAAAPVTPATPATPAGPGGAGAMIGPRFPVAGESPSILSRLEMLPIWDEDGLFFGLPARRYAKVLHEVEKSDPNWPARARLAFTLPRHWAKKDGMAAQEVQHALYLAQRLALIPPMRLEKETYGRVRAWLGKIIDGIGLNGALTREVAALNRLAEMDHEEKRKRMNGFAADLFRKRNDPGWMARSRGEGRLKEAQILTGKV